VYETQSTKSNQASIFSQNQPKNPQEKAKQLKEEVHKGKLTEDHTFAPKIRRNQARSASERKGAAGNTGLCVRASAVGSRYVGGRGAAMIIILQ
jgi:hypothetical protein